jgi:predicted deacylase
MIINKQEILPGENQLVHINVSKLPSGTKINIEALVFRSENPGPVMLVIGGVHGDEINGIEIVRRAVKSEMFNNLKCGSVIAIPVLNVFGFINFSRELPDGKDVNRSFPGSSKGSLASRVARALSKQILPLIDFGIDFHTGGASVFNYPQIRVSGADAKSIDLALEFSAPYIIKSGLIAKSLRKECTKRNIPMLVYEGGESLRLDEFAIQEGLEGLERIMNYRNFSDSKTKGQSSVIFQDSTWLRAPESGLFISLIKVGDQVIVDEKIGKITDPYGHQETFILANKTGIVFGLNNRPVVNVGDALFHIGYNIELNMS